MSGITAKTDIRTLSFEELKAFFVANGERGFRAKQVWEWLWKKSARRFEDMTNLSKSTRAMLSSNFDLLPLHIADEQVSSDRTIKCAFRSHDRHVVEGVLIPTDSRMTACISSQVGCSLTCKFCATGRLKRLRNLTAAEIYDQVIGIRNLAEKHYQQPLSNIVYMGMGEPLLNYREMMESVHYITSEEGLNWSPKRITVSTAGIAKVIRRLGDDDAKFNLALSLHAANDVKRSKIMPINRQNSLEALAEALRYYYRQTGKKVTYEYIIFDAFNDELQDARELARFCAHIPCKVNIIEYNPIDEGEFQQADPQKVDAFAAYLESKNIVVNIRRSRGKDIDAACGQLANKNQVFQPENA
ncbi:MAG: 23S rRNA (adenine(2503)-C(2))-methyltransferase RlmN [Salibacteraceae bacterium]